LIVMALTVSTPAYTSMPNPPGDKVVMSSVESRVARNGEGISNNPV